MANDPSIIVLLVKMITGFAATVSAVVLWSKTREAAWLFIVTGTVFLYGEVIIQVLELYGLTDLYLVSLYGIPVVSMIFALFPFLFFTAGFLVFLFSRRRRF